jgi:SAM-dependent methyltransferase
MPVDREIQERQKAIWAAGDYATVATRIESVSEEVVARVGVEEGTQLLDVATGTGNAALFAAAAGAQVTGLDLTPKLLVTARERAAEAGYEIEFVEGDAQELPFEDDSFDRVTSVFGAMFAPDQARTAAELVRVCRPGGRIGVTAWRPEGLFGRLFKTMASHLPPPPPGFQPPVLWGVEDHVRGLFAPLGAEVEFEPTAVLFEDESLESWMADGESRLPPMVMAKAALEPSGDWDALRAELVTLYEGANEADDGSFRAHAEYLITIATPAG